MGIATSIERSNTNCPPLDNGLACHPSILLSTFSMTSCQSCLDILSFFSGRPKYCIGKLPISIPKASKHCSPSSLVSPNPIKADLIRFIYRLKKFANRSRSVDKFFASSTKPSIRNAVSSVYYSRGTPSE